MTDKGIDYGLGQTNIDERGIRYGIIPLNSLAYWASGEFEPDYGKPSCGHCGSEFPEDIDTDSQNQCRTCGETTEGYPENYYPEEALSWDYEGEGEGLQLHLDSSNDVWVLKSPYVTRAQYCSPCAPGAVYLSSPCDDGDWGYCLPPDWFDDDCPIPYKAYELALAKYVYPELRTPEEKLGSRQ